MKKEVNNGPIMRVFRTIGYALLFTGAFILLLDALSVLNIAFISEYLTTIDNYISDNFGTSLFGLKYWLFLVGTILLVLCLSKNVILITLTLLILVVSIININLTGAIFFTNFMEALFIKSSFFNNIAEFFNTTINQEQLVPLVLNIMTPFLIYVLIASKKPSRIATKIVSSGFLMLTIVAVFYSLAIISSIPFLQTTTYYYIINIVLSISLLSLIVGSVFGILGIFRK